MSEFRSELAVPIAAFAEKQGYPEDSKKCISSSLSPEKSVRVPNYPVWKPKLGARKVRPKRKLSSTDVQDSYSDRQEPVSEKYLKIHTVRDSTWLFRPAGRTSADRLTASLLSVSVLL